MPVALRIAEILEAADVERLIEIGCPRDEYWPEAEAIALELYPDRQSPEAVQLIVESVWRGMFELSELDIAHRRRR
jgi:hypothetical protein